MISSDKALSLLFDKYGDPIEVEKVASLDELNLIEIFSQERIKENPDFDVFEKVVFNRSPMGLWPDCSVIGDYYYRKGEIKKAYQVFRSIRDSGLAPDSIPTWSQGIYGMQLKRSEKQRVGPDLNLIKVFSGVSEGGGVEACVGFDINYLPFFNIFKKSASNFGVGVNAVVCYDDFEDVAKIVKEVDLGGVNLYAIKTPDGLSFRNRKGFYTLSRYLLSRHVLGEERELKGLFVTDVDAVLLELDRLTSYLDFDYDIGVIELNKPRRPWLKHTAPFLFLSNTRLGVKFSNEICGRAIDLMDESGSDSGVSLWGGDQAIITSTIDYLTISEDPLKVFNFVKHINHFMQQAQSLGKNKNAFLNQYG